MSELPGLAEDDARRADAADPGWRELFHIPPAEGGRYAEAAYLVGNSLGLQPRAARADVMDTLDTWARRGIEGFHEGEHPWLTYPQDLAHTAARLVGALPAETVVMSSLTVNLHLLMASFYRPHGERVRIVVEDNAFPSDSYAVRSQVRLHGFDPDDAVVRLSGRPGENILRTDDVVEFLRREGHTVALMLLGGVNFHSGQLLDIAAITRAAHDTGTVAGWDLAHAAGNVPLHLHEWDVDFAAWCSYKYLNSGPGAPGAAFIHERHLGADGVQRLEGWWGNDPATRFQMQPVFRPAATADAWQVSTPSAVALSPMRSALEAFDKVGMEELRARSIRLTGYLERLVDDVSTTHAVEIVTARDPQQRGCQLSLRVPDVDASAVVRELRRGFGVMTDARQPDIIRAAPTPLYSTYHDCWRLAEALRHTLPARG